MRRRAVRLFVLAAGAFWAWQYRFYVNPDGVAYLDLADRIREHGWTFAINAHWSPLVPWMYSFIRVAPYWESTVAHAIAFGMFCLAFAAFEFLLRELRRDDLIAYALFLWSCNFADETGPAVLSPDLLVNAELFLAAALLVRIARGDRRWGTWTALGASLGAGYLAKAPILPLGVCILAMAAILGGWRAAWSAVLMLAISALYFVPLSQKLGRLSIGDSGRHNYIWRVASVGEPVHPRQVLFDDPLVQGFGVARDGGTYALHDDPGYWMEGRRPHFELRAQLRAVWNGAKVYLDAFRSPLHLALLVVLLLAGNAIASLRRYWYLAFPALAALAMFAMVLVEVRYVSAAIVLLWLSLLDGLRPIPQAAVIAVVVIASLGLADNRSDLEWSLRGAPPEDWRLAQSLTAAGLRAGDRVGFVTGPGYMCYWARLAKLRLVAEAPDTDEFWNADEEARTAAAAAMFRYGARALVALDAPDDAGPCWRRVPDTSYSVCLGVQ